MKTFFCSLMYFFNRSICFVWSVSTGSTFFCSTILMKESIDDLTNQAIDLVLENDALHERVVKPLRRKILPYVVCSVLTNISMLILLFYLARRLSVLQTPLM